MIDFEEIEEQDREARASLGGPSNRWKDSFIAHMVSERARQSEHEELVLVLDRIATALENK